MNENEIAKGIVDACVKIHKALGPGLLESAYEAVLGFELKNEDLVWKHRYASRSFMKMSGLKQTTGLICLCPDLS